MKNLVLDLETSDLKDCEILSICWCFIGEELNYWTRKGGTFKISEGSTKVNGFTREILESLETSITINEIFDKIKNDLLISDKIISHNITFDLGILMEEAYRNNRHDILEILADKAKRADEIGISNVFFCSMRNTVNICKLVRNNKYKFPKLSELYKFCFGKEMENLHNSYYDVKNLIECLVYLNENKLISI